MKTLIIDDVHFYLIDKLRSEGFELLYKPDIKEDEFLQLLPSIEIMVVRSKFKITQFVIEKAQKLKLIARAGAGMDNIDVEEAEKHKITLVNAAEGNRNAVAEHALSLLLNVFNKINQGDSQVRNQIFDRETNRGEELAGKTIGIIGYGNTGKAFAKILSGFDVEVLAYDRYLKNYSDQYARESSMEEINNLSDIISLHVPLDASNKELFNQQYYNRFKKPIFIINTSRGELLQFDILLNLINKSKISGFGLDVFENEKFETFTNKQKVQFSKLSEYPFGIFSPHVAGWTTRSYLKISEVLAKKIIQFKNNFHE